MADDDQQANALLTQSFGLQWNGKPLLDWNKEDVAEWLKSIGFDDAAELFVLHEISGATLPLLTDQLLIEMGMNVIGRRVKLLSYIANAEIVSRQQHRSTLLWEGEQYRPGCFNGCFPFRFPFCCVPCAGIPDQYKVMHSKVHIKKVKKRCGYSCCGEEVLVNNIDVSTLRDIDTQRSTACIGDPRGFVFLVDENENMTALELRSSDCDKVAGVIQSAMEEATMDKSHT